MALRRDAHGCLDAGCAKLVAKGLSLFAFECGSGVLRVCSAALLAMTVVAGSALAQKADRPVVKVGDQWQFVVYYGIPSTEPNRVWVVNSVSPTEIAGTENGEPLTLTSDLNVSKASFRGISKVGGVVEGASTGTYWYAPAARTIVKSVTLNPYRGAPTVELVGFQLQP